MAEHTADQCQTSSFPTHPTWKKTVTTILMSEWQKCWDGSDSDGLLLCNRKIKSKPHVAMVVPFFFAKEKCPWLVLLIVLLLAFCIQFGFAIISKLEEPNQSWGGKISSLSLRKIWFCGGTLGVGGPSIQSCPKPCLSIFKSCGSARVWGMSIYFFLIFEWGSEWGN